MKPTITNAFNDNSMSSESQPAKPGQDSWELRSHSTSGRAGRNPRRSLASSLAPMQADLRETEFGWSLELSPMTAVDALLALHRSLSGPHTQMFLVSMEQSGWRDGDAGMSITDVMTRLAIPVIETIGPDQLVMDEQSLRQVVSLCQPTRLLAIVIEGAVDQADARAINKAVEAGRSPLLAELRATAALEVLGDRSVVLHCRNRDQALAVVAENFSHYLAALTNRPATQFDAPELWQLERLFSATGMLTIRPIETQVFSTSIDVGINTSKQRFSQPADRSLIYDVFSNTWHDEP